MRHTRTKRLVRRIRGKRDTAALRRRRQDPDDYYYIDDGSEVPQFKPTRRWRRHDQEMDTMVHGTSGRHTVMQDA